MSRRLSVLLLPVLLIAGQLTAPAARAAAPACEAATTQAQAVSKAKACGGPVEDLSARTEYSQTFAEASGLETQEISVVPQRAKRRDGTWAAIDTTLQRSGDAVTPTAAASNLRFSPGGTAPFASMTVQGKTFSLAWPYGTLPAPTLNGDTATYAEVLPDVDLVVRATDSAFSHYLVVKTATAAKDPRVRETRYTVGGDAQLVSTADGGLTARAGDTTVAIAGEARMWDTPRYPSDRELAMSGAEPPSRRFARVAGRAAGTELILAPDKALLDSGRLPLVIDPLWNPGQAQWAYATSSNNDAPTIDEKVTGGDPWPAQPILRSGNDTVGRVNRSFMRFDIGTVAYKHILDANLSGRVDHTWKCGSDRPNYFYRTAPIAATPRQNWPGPGLEVYLGNNSVHANEADCTDPNMVFEVFSGTLTNDLQLFSNNGWGSYYIGICACSDGSGTGEWTQDRWMRYFLYDFRLNIAFNTLPSIPANLTVDGKACATGASRPYIKAATPTLRAVLGDNDGNSMTAQFETARIRYDNTVGPVSMTPQQGSIPSGGTGLVSLPSGVLDGTDTFVATGDWNNDGRPDVLSVDAAGDLYLLPGKAGGLLDKRVISGSGWGAYTVAGVVDWDRDGQQDIIARENANGNLWIYPGGGGSRAHIGAGWNEYVFAGLADWDRDGHQDIITQDWVGDMWLYPGESTRTFSTQPRVWIGSGWTGYTYLGTKDWNRDGAPDLVVYDSGGMLWGYPGSGARSIYPGYPYRFNIGVGWGGYQAKLINDVNGDAKVDILAKQPGVTDWFVYPGAGDWIYGPERFTTASVGVHDGGRFVFRANAFDGWDWAPSPSGWCEFELDLTPPAVPTVNADIYKEGQTSGSVGQTGRFTFTSSSDTQSFLWGFSDPPTNPLTPQTLGGSVFIDWTPPSGGPRTLYVKAIDRAGNERQKAYQFYVAPESTAVARWRLNETFGASSFADETGNGHDASLGGATLGGTGRIAPGNDGMSKSAASFGVGSAPATAATVLTDTSKSFSVAAWVKLGDAAATRSAVSQGNGFFLECNSSKWRFRLSSGSPAVSTSTAKLGVWTHLAGTYDSAAKQLKLYVNGTLEATVNGVSSVDADGVFEIGDTWAGSLAEAQAWNRMISATEVANLYDPSTNALVAKWDMSDVGPGPTFDSSNLAHDLEFFPQPGGPQIPPAGSGHTGTGLNLDGVDDNARTAEPVLYTDQSFTVSAWVNLSAAATGNRAVISQFGTAESAFYLKYEPTQNKWVFVYGDMEGAPGTGNAAYSIGPAVKGSWTHLVGVYDAQAGQIKLYVNGAPQDTQYASNPWNATGPVNIGRVLWHGTERDYWPGSIDEIRIYQGAITNIGSIS
ncbi:MAG TPA: LamG-like jellyroll fold domain-containing protein [Candidatus Limnocylindrales bacterium]|nr:LamG-like jellyroll fold domain-containing protein [Candidatus Limnocylindrales bacterium]